MSPTVNTDKYAAYNQLKVYGFVHEQVEHSKNIHEGIFT